MSKYELAPLVQQVSQRILFLRGERVILDMDLAKVYGVSTKALNQAVKRNASRFPIDFAFRLTTNEKKQVVTNCDHLGKLKFSPSLPYAFTEHGAIMAASVLNSPRAVESSIFVVRAFVKLREILASNKELASKLDELESRLDGHDEALQQIVAAIRQLAAPIKERKSRRLGFSRPVVKQGAHA